MLLRFIKLLMLAIILSSCASPVQQAESLVSKGEWLNAVLEYRKALAKEPGDIELRSRLKQIELKAADFYYQQGLKLLEKNNIDAAIVEYQRGLIAKPDHGKLEEAMKSLLNLKEANNLYIEGMFNKNAGRNKDAQQLFLHTLKIFPDHEKANIEVQRYRLKLEDEGQEFALTSENPITLKFKKTDIRTTFQFLAKSFGINVIFDESIKDMPVTMFAKNVTFEQALNLLLVTTKTFYKKLGKNTILLSPDNKEKRGQYEDYIIRIFTLRSIKAKDMAAMLKNILSLKKIQINEKQNTVIVRATETMLSLVDKVIVANDRKPAELIMDVEILEVNRTKTEQLGLDFGSKIGVSYPTFTGSLSAALSQGTVTLPSVSFRYFKQDVDAKILANPKIRVIDDKPAKIHIGDRVPLRSSTIQDATGQTRTTFEYKDIGIKLTVEPDIHLDNSVTVKLGLEVSSLGQNLGTVAEPAFSIGTRNADTHMLLRDGETAILGGLIRDEDRSSLTKVPGFGDIPIIGRLFSVNDDQATRTDVLLTITPRIVRGWDVPPKDMRNIYSGTEKNYTNRSIFFNFETEKKNKDAEFSIEAPGSEKLKARSNGKNSVQIIKLGFDKSAFTVMKDSETEIHIVGKNLQDVKFLPFDILYNPNLLSFVEGIKSEINAKTFTATEKSGQGTISVSLNELEVVDNEEHVLGKIFLKGLKPGISYLVFRTNNYQGKNGNQVKSQVQTSRIIVH